MLVFGITIFSSLFNLEGKKGSLQYIIWDSVAFRKWSLWVHRTIMCPGHYYEGMYFSFLRSPSLLAIQYSCRLNVNVWYKWQVSRHLVRTVVKPKNSEKSGCCFCTGVLAKQCRKWKVVTPSTFHKGTESFQPISVLQYTVKYVFAHSKFLGEQKKDRILFDGFRMLEVWRVQPSVKANPMSQWWVHVCLHVWNLPVISTHLFMGCLHTVAFVPASCTANCAPFWVLVFDIHRLLNDTWVI